MVFNIHPVLYLTFPALTSCKTLIGDEDEGAELVKAHFEESHLQFRCFDFAMLLLSVTLRSVGLKYRVPWQRSKPGSLLLLPTLGGAKQETCLTNALLIE